MEKEQIIKLIKESLDSGEITKDDLSNIVGVGNSSFNIGATMPDAKVGGENPHASSLIKIFYAIGAIIVLVGIVILIAQYWEDIGFIGRILVTLGIAIATYVSALLMKEPEKRVISQVLFTISAVLAPIGTFVLLEEANIDFEASVQILFALIMLVVYGVAYFANKRNILVVIMVAFFTWAYYAFIVEFFGIRDFEDVVQWATIVLGLSYVGLAYSYAKLPAFDSKDSKERKSVGGLLYGAGTIAVLGAGITIGGFFDLVMVLLIFGAFYGSIFLKSRMMLILGAIFLVAHIIKITFEYFEDSLSWPILLVFIGFLIIGIGYLTFHLNRKFISA